MNHPPNTPLTRRSLIIGSAASTALILTSRYTGWAQAQPKIEGNPFALGIASGDPSPDGMVLWTKLSPDPLSDASMGPDDIPVRWQIASDEAMKNMVQQGTATAAAAWGHSVHLEVEGLQPGRHYWYQFETAGVVSPIGRTRTMPALDSRPDRLRFAFASCQNWPNGFYAAYRQMAHEDLDLVVHLGDYIYEGRINSNQRGAVLPVPVMVEPKTLEGYRLRYALYKLDPDLQAAHANFPFMVTWDDHEVENDYAGDHDRRDSPPAQFLVRRAAAYQAYYEHLPLRRSSMPKGPDMQLYRRLTFGDLAQFNMLDTRQYRSDQISGPNRQLRSAQALDPARVFMGGPQAEWLMTGMAKSPARWNVLAQQVIMTQLAQPTPEGPKFSVDAWDGYPAERARLMEFLATSKPRNPIVLSGDSHTNLVSDLKADFDKNDSAIVGVEFAGTAISSSGVNSTVQKAVESEMGGQPHLKWFEGIYRGYVSCTVERNQWKCDFMQVKNLLDSASPVKTSASFIVEDNKPGVHRL